MLTRVELYELLRYEAYGQSDAAVRDSEPRGDADASSGASKAST
jgi:hypothetical protein